MTAGSTFGDYAVVRLLGKGGMGEVWLLEGKSGNQVAAKILDAGADHESRKRFLREAQLALGVKHPNLVETYDVGEDPETGLCYILMEYVPGGTLADYIKANGALAIEDAVAVVEAIAGVLELGRQKGIVHRDIKPANIMFDAEGTPKLADLGIARAGAAGNETTTVMQTGAMIGTPAYMSPEQMLDAHNVDTRADIYSLGVVFFEMLTGERPNKDDTIVQLMAKAVKGEPLPDVRTLRPEVSASLAQLLSMMVAPDKDGRISTPGQITSALAIIERGGEFAVDAESLPRHNGSRSIDSGRGKDSASTGARQDASPTGRRRNQAASDSSPAGRAVSMKPPSWLIPVLVLAALAGAFFILAPKKQHVVRPIVTTNVVERIVEKEKVVKQVLPAVTNLVVKEIVRETIKPVETNRIAAEESRQSGASRAFGWIAGPPPIVEDARIVVATLLDRLNREKRNQLDSYFQSVAPTVKIDCVENRSIRNLDLTNVPLLFLWDRNAKRPYDEGEVNRITEYLENGGNVVVLAHTPKGAQDRFLQNFGLTVLGMRAPGEVSMKAVCPDLAGETIGWRATGCRRSPEDAGEWHPMIVCPALDPEEPPVVMAMRFVGRGKLFFVASGTRDSFSGDSHNRSWWRKVLRGFGLAVKNGEADIVVEHNRAEASSKEKCVSMKAPVAQLKWLVGEDRPQPVPPVRICFDQSHGGGINEDGAFYLSFLSNEKGFSHKPCWYGFDKENLSHVNVVVLPLSHNNIPYLQTEREALRTFMEKGGTVVSIVDGNDCNMSISKVLLSEYGLAVVSRGRARDDADIEKARGTCPALEDIRNIDYVLSTVAEVRTEKDAAVWSALVAAADGAPLVACRSVGKGHLVYASAGLCFSKERMRDHASTCRMWKRLFFSAAKERRISPKADLFLRNVLAAPCKLPVGPITLHYADRWEKDVKMIAGHVQKSLMALKQMGVPDITTEQVNFSNVALLGTGNMHWYWTGGKRQMIGILWGGSPAHPGALIANLVENILNGPLCVPEDIPLRRYLGLLCLQKIGLEPEFVRLMPRAESTDTQDQFCRAFEAIRKDCSKFPDAFVSEWSKAPAGTPSPTFFATLTRTIGRDCRPYFTREGVAAFGLGEDAAGQDAWQGKLAFSDREIAKMKGQQGDKAAQKAFDRLFPGWKVTGCSGVADEGRNRVGYVPELDGRRNLCCTLPGNSRKPVKFKKVVTVPQDDPKLFYSIRKTSRADAGFELEILIDGKVVNERRIDDGDWVDESFDLSAWKGKKIQLEIRQSKLPDMKNARATWSRLEVR